MNDPFAWAEEDEPTAMTPVFDGTDPLEIVKSIPPWIPPSPVSATVRPEWDIRLVIDYVLGASKESIMAEYNILDHHYERITRDIGFLGKVASLKKELAEKDGATFQLKAKLQAEDLIEEAYKMSKDPNCDPRVRAKLIGDIVRWAGFDKTGMVADSTGGFSVSITLNTKRIGDTFDGETIDV